MTTVASLAVEITGDISGLDRAMGQANQKVTRFGQETDNMLTRVGDRIRGMGTDITKITAPLIAIGVVGVHTASQFDVAMREISARTGLVGQDLENVREFALQMGADTSFSAQQAAEGLLQLLASGSDAQEAIATLPGVMNLAAASGMDLGYTADVLTNVMKTFGLTTDDAASIADTLTQAAGSSSATVQSLTDSIVNAGAQANLLGFSLEDTVAALAILAESGLSGSEAGTALSSMMRTMAGDASDTKAALDALGVSIYDAEGNARPLATIISDLSQATEGLSDQEENKLLTDIGGAYGLKALAALTNTTDGIDSMKESMDDAAGASDVADAKLGGFAGAIEALKGSVETLNIEAFTPLMEDVLEPMARHFTEIVNGITEWVRENPELVTQIMSLVIPVAAIGAGLFIMGTAVSALGTAAKLAMGPLGLIALGIWFVAETDWEAVNGGIDKMADGFERLREGNTAGALEDVAGGIGQIIEATPIGDAANGIINFLERITGWDLAGVEEGFRAWGTALEHVRQIVERTFNDISRRVRVAADDIRNVLAEIGLRSGIAAIDVSLMNPLIGGGEREMLENVRAAMSGELVDIEMGRRIRAEIDAAVKAAGPLDLSEIGVVFDDTGEIQISLETMLAIAAENGNYSDLTDRINEGATWAIEDAMWRLAMDMNQEQFDLLLPLAAELGIDTAAMKAELYNRVMAALYGMDLGTIQMYANASVSVGTVAAVVAGQQVLAPQSDANGPFRSGLDYVPYDGYVAMLHRGEQVLTENEARGRGSQPIVVNVTAYGTNEQEFAELVRRAMAGMAR